MKSEKKAAMPACNPYGYDAMMFANGDDSVQWSDRVCHDNDDDDFDLTTVAMATSILAAMAWQTWTGMLSRQHTCTCHDRYAQWNMLHGGACPGYILCTVRLGRRLRSSLGHIHAHMLPVLLDRMIHN